MRRKPPELTRTRTALFALPGRRLLRYWDLSLSKNWKFGRRPADETGPSTCSCGGAPADSLSAFRREKRLSRKVKPDSLCTNGCDVLEKSTRECKPGSFGFLCPIPRISPGIGPQATQQGSLLPSPRRLAVFQRLSGFPSRIYFCLQSDHSKGKRHSLREWLA